MLRQINQCNLTTEDRLGAMFQSCVALDTNTGAMLTRTAGRPKNGMSKYILVLPTQTPAERGGYFASYLTKSRSVIRGYYSLPEAVDIANRRLQKMIEKGAIDK